MPLPNEHACRLRDPGDFQDDSFRRMERDHEGKKYSVIMGRLKGEDTMTEQAYRYSKETWDAGAAGAHCRAHDGSFEAASGGEESVKPPKYADYETKAEVDREERTIVVKISTDTKDRDAEVLIPSGAKLERYLKNPVVLWAHKYDSLPIGRALWIKSGKKDITAKVQFAPSDEAQKVFDLYAGGYLRAWSVGFLPLEGKGHRPTAAETKKRPEWEGANWIHDEWEMLEFSGVPVPANPDALSLAVHKGLVKVLPEINLPSVPQWTPGEKEPDCHEAIMRPLTAFKREKLRREERDHRGRKYIVILGEEIEGTDEWEHAYYYPRAEWDYELAVAHARAYGAKSCVKAPIIVKSVEMPKPEPIPAEEIIPTKLGTIPAKEIKPPEPKRIIVREIPPKKYTPPHVRVLSDDSRVNAEAEAFLKGKVVFD